ncbi:MAG: 4-hydroxy-3-methylbut-2-enyl diphosphate reductase [Gemmatimonadetes bacterium]|nr:4-hydroxy-3-methylbut-2-enyl diphosphate reductase [Gemmatimonadota bacterium]
MTEATYFRKGFGLKNEIAGALSADYHSRLVERIRAGGHGLTVGDLTFRLAREFGFCYGVDRAVEYAYETREKFPGRRLFLVGEIIHNPHVNRRMTEKGITILAREPAREFAFRDVRAEDVVILPAFGVTVRDFERLRQIGCVLVDTTCGSVLNVWKRVERYARDGFTALVHGKHYHEETRATVSQVTRFSGGKYLIVRDMEEAELVCRHIERGGDAADLARRFALAVSEGFDFAADLERVGVANQTTMLARESLAIAERVRDAFARRYGAENVDAHFRSFDTICSATQERQDAVIEMMKEPLDVMVVIGGYNSSNTMSLARMCAQHVTTFHVEDALGIDPEAGVIRHQPVGGKEEVAVPGWLKPGPLSIGITAGASTPNNKIGEAVARILRSRGLDLPEDAA